MAFINCAHLNALYKFPGKGTEKQINFGCTIFSLSSNMLSVRSSINVGLFCRLSYSSSNALALCPKRSAYLLKPKLGSIHSIIKSDKSSRYKVAKCLALSCIPISPKAQSISSSCSNLEACGRKFVVHICLAKV